MARTRARPTAIAVGLALGFRAGCRAWGYGQNGPQSSGQKKQ